MRSIAALRTGRAVRIQLDRNTDMALMGKRHPTLGQYMIGVKRSGQLMATQISFYSNGGGAYDSTLGCMDMNQLWADNVYFAPNYLSKGFCMRTNLPPNTASA